MGRKGLCGGGGGGGGIKMKLIGFTLGELIQSEKIKLTTFNEHHPIID